MRGITNVNNFTNEEKAKLQGIESGAEVNNVDDVKIDNVSIVENKIANILAALTISDSPVDTKLVTEKTLYNYIASGNNGDARLLSNVDLDYVYNTGFYFCNMCNHRPVTANGILIVSKIVNNTNYAVQMYMAFAEDETYIRYRDNNAWGNWKRVASDEDITSIVSQLSLKQDAIDDTLETTNKNIVSAINEVNSATLDLNTNKQNVLVSGTNIKTLNNQSLLGSGNIAVDSVPTSGSNNLITSDAVYRAIGDIENSLSNINSGSGVE